MFAAIFKEDRISSEQMKKWIGEAVATHLLEDEKGIPEYYQSKLILQSHLGEAYKNLLS